MNNEYSFDDVGRPRFFGIYSATVVDINDPLKKSRIKVQVHMPTGGEKTNWAEACLPITSNANHPDHEEHLASEVAALLTTTPVSASGSGSGGDPQGGSVSVTTTTSIPALTIVPKTGAGTLKHPHKTDPDETELWNDDQETNTTAEHSPHRIVPYGPPIVGKGQNVWVMFIAGDPSHPVWIGVQP